MQNSKSRPPFKFYFSILIFLAINSITYYYMIFSIIHGNFGNIGTFGPLVYIGSSILVPVIAFYIFRWAKMDSGCLLRLIALPFPYIFIISTFLMGIDIVAVDGIILSVFGWGWIPMSWYNFREKRWEEK